MKPIDVTLHISDEVLGYLQREAEQRKVSLDVVVSDVLEEYYDDPSEEEILHHMRIAVQQGLAGDVIPIDEALAQLKEEFDFDADEN